MSDSASVLDFVPLALMAAPFALLALLRIRQRRPWVVATGLTLLYWVLFLADVMIRRGAGGVNIGLGFLMLVWPLVVTTGALVTVKEKPE